MNAVKPKGGLAWSIPLAGVIRDVMHSGDGLECSLAVKVLHQIGGNDARELLLKCLHHEDPDVRSDAACALAGFEGEGAVNALMDNLKIDPVGEIKVVYIEALQALEASACVKTLRILAQGRGEEHDIHWEDDQTGWDDWLDVQRAAIEALGHLSKGDEAEATVAVILDALADPDGQDLWAIACRALARLGRPGCIALNNLLVEASQLNRKRIATALASADNTESEAILLELLQDADINVRIAALESGSERALASICDAGLQNNIPAVRAKTLESFDGFDKAHFLTALNDIDAGVKIAACQAILRADKPFPGLGLVKQAERQLRASAPEFLAALVGAMSVAEPGQATGLVEEIVNHKATAPVVRLAAMRALGKLMSAGAVECLAIGVADNKQDIRLEAIVALGRIAKTSGEVADRATLILASAIQGELVKAPAGWQLESDNIAHFEPKKKNIEDEKGVEIHLNRDGEVQSEKPAAEALAEENIPESPPPLSTLEAILSFQPVEPEPSSAIEISDDDIAFLELAGSRPGKRKIDPSSTVPAHIDVQRLAARMAGETGKEQLVSALAIAAISNDNVVCEAALESLNRLASGGIDIVSATAAVLQQSGSSKKAVRARAIDTLAWVNAPQADDILDRTLNDPSGTIRASGLAAISKRGGEVGVLRELCRDEDRHVRQTAATLLSEQSGTTAIPDLMGYALIENAAHKTHAACLLTGCGNKAITAVVAWINGDDQIKRIVGLEVLATMLNKLCESGPSK